MLPSEFLAELELAYSLNKSIKRIKVEVMPIMIKNLKLIASRVENKPDYLNPTAKKLLQCGN
jgi:hypothetical protein